MSKRSRARRPGQPRAPKPGVRAEGGPATPPAAPPVDARPVGVPRPRPVALVATPSRAGGRRSLPWLWLGLGAVAIAVIAAILLRGIGNGPATGAATQGPTASQGPSAATPAGNTASAAASGTGSAGASGRAESTASFSAGASLSGALVQGAPLPEFVPEAADAAVGRTIPAIVGRSYKGEGVTIRADDGRAKAILFVAHWCPHCQREVPLVQSWLSGGGSTGGVDLYAVATGNDPARPNYPPGSWLERERWTVPTVMDDAASSIGQAYGLSAFPFWVFVRADGTVAARASGEMTIEELRQALAGAAG